MAEPLSALSQHPDRAGIDQAGVEMMAMIDTLWPITRSLQGPGIRQTLEIIGDRIGGLEITKVVTGAKVLDWIIPDEWHPRAAFIETPTGERICDLAENNLHLVGHPNHEL